MVRVSAGSGSGAMRPVGRLLANPPRSGVGGGGGHGLATRLAGGSGFLSPRRRKDIATILLPSLLFFMRTATVVRVFKRIENGEKQ